MIRDSRLSGVLHLLLHLADHEGPMPSDQLARAMGTNATVIRRILAGLRERGHVRSEKGHGGGWTLARPLAELTLHDIYDALGRPSLLAIGNRSQAPQCLVEQAVNAALDETFDAAETLLLDRLGRITLADLQSDFRARLAAHPYCSKDPSHGH